MRTADFDFELPSKLIAQIPAPERDQSRLLVLDRASGKTAHHKFRDLLEYLRPGDVLVLNNSRVIPARLRGMNVHTKGQFELLLLTENATNDWWAMLRPGKRARPGTQISIRDPGGAETPAQATVIEKNEEGHRRLQFTGVPDIRDKLDALGEIPLPPYIERSSPGTLEADRRRYQTVYAEPAGSVAAPTAGLHFTEALLDEIRARGVHVCFVTLHVGLGTFAPVKTETLAAHTMHEEYYELSAETARTITDAKRTGRRVIAVGTTTVRVLESAFGVHPLGCSSADEFVVHPLGCSGSPTPGTDTLKGGHRTQGRTNIFIYPPFEFRIADALLTNFHLPRSTLLMLVSAFAAPGETRGREMVLSAYKQAIREHYRFFSYGDAMLVL
jgi:S-adenosylmethionine:tRNA ribosyltransferase-isomerase